MENVFGSAVDEIFHGDGGWNAKPKCRIPSWHCAEVGIAMRLPRDSRNNHRQHTHLDIGELLTLAMPLLPRVNQGLICHILGAILGAIF